MHIALFGGKFDPPHLAHSEIVKNIVRSKVVDEVWLLPANTHPWRNIVASANDRINMLRFLEKPHIKIADIEIQRGGETYTIDTIKYLHATTTHTYYWICGLDQIQQLPKWKRSDELQKIISFFVFPRGTPSLSSKSTSYRLLPPLRKYAHCSSTVIREKIKQGRSIDRIVLPEVKEYIERHKLYV